MGGPNSHGSSRQLETSKLLLQVHLVLEGQGRGLGYYHSFASSELVKKRLVQVRLLLSLILYLPLLLLLLDIHEFGVFVLDIISCEADSLICNVAHRLTDGQLSILTIESFEHPLKTLQKLILILYLSSIIYPSSSICHMSSVISHLFFVICTFHLSSVFKMKSSQNKNDKN